MDVLSLNSGWWSFDFLLVCTLTGLKLSHCLGYVSLALLVFVPLTSARCSWLCDISSQCSPSNGKWDYSDRRIQLIKFLYKGTPFLVLMDSCPHIDGIFYEDTSIPLYRFPKPITVLRTALGEHVCRCVVEGILAMVLLTVFNDMYKRNSIKTPIQRGVNARSRVTHSILRSNRRSS